MKRLIFTAILSITLYGAFAQNKPADSTKTGNDSTKSKALNFL